MEYFRHFQKQTIPSMERHFIVLKIFSVVLLSNKTSKTVMICLLSTGSKTEIVSIPSQNKVYGRPDFAWVLALYNEIIDPFSDLGYNANDLDEYINKKYEGTSLVVYKGRHCYF